jgi:hypothetical protein
MHTGRGDTTPRHLKCTTITYFSDAEQYILASVCILLDQGGTSEVVE